MGETSSTRLGAPAALEASAPDATKSSRADGKPAAARTPRILLLSDRYLPHVGGSVYWCHNLYLRRPRGTVWIATQDYPNAADFDRAHPQFHVYRRSLKRYPFLRPESLLLYLKLLATGFWIVLRHRIELIHAAKVLPEGLVARLLSKVFRIPYVTFCHGEEVTIFQRSPRHKHHMTRVYDDAGAVVANSSFTREQLLGLGCHGRNIVKISPGVDPVFFSPGPPDGELVTRLGLQGKKVLLSVGRLTRRKGHDRVLEALPRILEKHPEAVYVIVSSGEEEGALRRLAADLRIEHAVRFAGEVKYEDLPGYYRTADVFILANRELPGGDLEGFGIVFLEANACAKPVIAGTSGGTGDPVRDGVNGYRIDAKDPRAIALTIALLFDNPERARAMGSAGRELVLAEYAWERVAGQVEDVHRRLLSPGVEPAPEAAGTGH